MVEICPTGSLGKYGPSIKSVQSFFVDLLQVAEAAGLLKLMEDEIALLVKICDWKGDDVMD
jgi:hypothetical protein